MGLRRRLVAFVSALATALAMMPLAAPAATGDPVLINEVLASTTGTDVEYFELYGNAGASLAGLSFIGIEGNDVAGPGTIDFQWDFGSEDALGTNGFYLVGTTSSLEGVYGVTPNADIAANSLENSSTTYALVETSSISGSSVDGSEVVLDAIGVTDATASTFFFGAPVFGPDGTFYPAGVRRIADGVDTDTVADWALADFDLGTANTPTAGVIPVVLEITELHYDNIGGDVGEGVEVSGPEGFDVTGWSIVLYNGSATQRNVYDSVTLAGIIPTGGAFTVYIAGIQNGSPDGIALVDDTGAVVEFLSYEGSFVAASGPASGMTSTDIGVEEPSDTPIGYSLQKVAGVWQVPAPNTFAPELGPTGPDCTVGVAPISLVQGDGAETPCDGQTVTIEGVVVGDYEGASPALRGFYVQDVAQDDGNENTSEGIFVFHGDEDTVALGDLVRVTATAAEFQNQTQLGFPGELTVLSSGNVVAPTTVTMPFPTTDYLERFEGMLVTFEQPLYVTEYFQLARFGEVVVSSGDRLRQPTDIAEPGAPANAVQAANDLNRLKIDDNLNDQNPDPILFGGGGLPLTAANPLRGGDTVTGATGVMTYGWAGNSASPNTYRLRVVGDLSDSGLVDGGIVPVFESANLRPTAPEAVGGTATVASFNVLNYFLTIDEGGATCGTPETESDNLGCRGADSEEEFVRQRDKLLAALGKVDTDVIGLMELENTTGVEPLADIVAGLGGAYDYVDTGTIGADVIKVGLVYRAGAVTPLGNPAILDYGDGLNRPSLAQSFTSDDGEVFTVVVSHFKSKGCSDSTGGDTDQGDGQGCYNPTRVAAAEALVDWIGSDPTGAGDPDVLLIGDFNSYAKEDPIDVLTAAGYTDLGRLFGGDETYSYVFDGQWGYLDYAFASASVVDRVEGATEYHINADEVPALDYNTEFKFDLVNVLYAADEFRTSDHDPVILGFCDVIAPDATAIADPSVLWPPNNKMVPVEVALDISDGSDVTVTLVSVESDEPDWDPKKGPDIVILDDTHFELRASRLGGGDGRVYTITYSAVDECGNETIFSTEVLVPHDQGN